MQTQTTLSNCGGACSSPSCTCARQPVRRRSPSPSPEPHRTTVIEWTDGRSLSPSPEPHRTTVIEWTDGRSPSPTLAAAGEEDEEDEDRSEEMDQSDDQEPLALGEMTDNGSAAIMQPTAEFVEKFRHVQRYYSGTFNLVPTSITFHDSLQDPFTPTVIQAFYRPRFIRHAREVSNDELAIAHVRLHFKIGFVVYERISSGFGYSVYLVRVNGDIKLVNIID